MPNISAIVNFFDSLPALTFAIAKLGKKANIAVKRSRIDSKRFFLFSRYFYQKIKKNRSTAKFERFVKVFCCVVELQVR